MVHAAGIAVSQEEALPTTVFVCEYCASNPRMRLTRSLLAFLLLFALTCGPTRAAEDRVLNLLCWTEYVPASVTDGFSHRTGVRVVV